MHEIRQHDLCILLALHVLASAEAAFKENERHLFSSYPTSPLSFCVFQDAVRAALCGTVKTGQGGCLSSTGQLCQLTGVQLREERLQRRGEVLLQEVSNFNFHLALLSVCRPQDEPHLAIGMRSKRNTSGGTLG